MRAALLLVACLVGAVEAMSPDLGVAPNATTCTGCELCAFILAKGEETGFEERACPRKGVQKDAVVAAGDDTDSLCVERLHTLGRQCYALNKTGCCAKPDVRDSLNNFTVVYVIDDFNWPALNLPGAMENFTGSFAIDVQQGLRTNATVNVTEVRFPRARTAATAAVLGSIEFRLVRGEQRDFVSALAHGNTDINAIPFSNVKARFGKMPIASAILKKDDMPSSIEVLKAMAMPIVTRTVQTELLRLNVDPNWVGENMGKFETALKTDISAQTGVEDSDVVIHRVTTDDSGNDTVVDVQVKGQSVSKKQLILTSLEKEIGDAVNVELTGISSAEEVVQGTKAKPKKTVVPPKPGHQYDPVRIEIKLRLRPSWVADAISENATMKKNSTYEMFSKQLSFDLSIALKQRHAVSVLSVRPSLDGKLIAIIRVKNWELATELDQQMADFNSILYKGVYSAYVDSTFDVDLPESPQAMKASRAKRRAAAERARLDFIQKTGGNSTMETVVAGTTVYTTRGADSHRCTNKHGGCDSNADCIEAWAAGSHWPNNWCQCNAGYEGDGFTCAPINACEEKDGKVGTQCGPDSTCTPYAPGRAKCLCNFGYSGDGLYCTEINKCQYGNGGCAIKGGICTKTGPGTSVCHCDTGADVWPFDGKYYFVGNGTHCEPYNPCKVNNGGCEKQAVCVFDGKPQASHCECAPGYISNSTKVNIYRKETNAPAGNTSKLFCEVLDICKIDNGNCSKNAQCRPSAPGQRQCRCKAGFVGNGEKCRAVDLCQADNGGCDTASSTCVVNQAGHNTCECKPGYEKAASGQCFAISACSAEKNPCHRSAICTDTAPGQYTCTCAKGYTGDGKYNCDVAKACNFHVKSITKCSDHQVCMLNTKAEREAGAAAHCECAVGYRTAGASACVPIRRCDQENATGCHVNASCIDWGPGRRKCSCNEGYHGTGYQCEEIDRCEINNGDCSPLAKCKNTGFGSRKCKCPDGFVTTDGGETCLPQNGCKKSYGGCHKHAMCFSPTPNSTSCICNLGYTGNGVKCEMLNNCNTGNDHCDANAHCNFTGPGTNNCTCNTGYKGSGAVCVAINNCNIENKTGVGIGECHEHAKCEMTGPGMHRCVCKTGWTGSGSVCEPIDNCFVGSHGCANDACCKMTGPGINHCTCNRGFIGDGKECKELNPCHYNNAGCHPSAVCKRTGPGRHSCTCPMFYTGDGKHCELDLSLCEPSAKHCDPNARCSPAPPGQKTCFCNAGYRGDGMSCQEISPCAQNSCPANTKCLVNSMGNQVCKCKDGFTGDGAKDCKLVNACLNKTCDDNAACIRYAPGMSRCVCKRGFFGNGTVCNKTDACALNNGGCSLNANCSVGELNERMCKCRDGFVGDGVECKDVSVMCCQCMSDTYGIAYGASFGHAPKAVINHFKKKGCETSPSIKARAKEPAGGDFSATPLPGGWQQVPFGMTEGAHIHGQPIAEAMGYATKKGDAPANDTVTEQ